MYQNSFLIHICIKRTTGRWTLKGIEDSLCLASMQISNLVESMFTHYMLNPGWNLRSLSTKWNPLAPKCLIFFSCFEWYNIALLKKAKSKQRNKGLLNKINEIPFLINTVWKELGCMLLVCFWVPWPFPTSLKKCVIKITWQWDAAWKLKSHSI